MTEPHGVCRVGVAICLCLQFRWDDDRHNKYKVCRKRIGLKNFVALLERLVCTNWLWTWGQTWERSDSCCQDKKQEDFLKEWRFIQHPCPERGCTWNYDWMRDFYWSTLGKSSIQGAICTLRSCCSTVGDVAWNLVISEVDHGSCC